MTCICPKCGAAIDQDAVIIPEDGAVASCPSCKARVQFVRESYARIAYGSLAAKNCAQCGSRLGSGLACTACGALYPDYFIAADPAELRRRARAMKQQQMLAVFKGVEFSLPSFSAARSGKRKPAFKSKADTKGLVVSVARSKNVPKLVAVLVILLLVFGGGYVVYAKNRAEKQYVDMYFKALYGIKTGADLSSKVTGRIATEWKAALDSGRSYSPLPTSDELSRLGRVKSEVDKLVTVQLASPPGNLAASREGLVKLNDLYAKMHALALSPPNSLPQLNDAAGKTAASFDESAKVLKSSLPKVMADELPNAKNKYKNLKDF